MKFRISMFIAIAANHCLKLVGWAESSRPTFTAQAQRRSGGPRRLGPPYASYGLLLTALLLFLTGCAEVTVHHAGNSDLLSDRRTNLMEADGLSARTAQTLRQLDLDHLYQDRPVEALSRLRSMTVKDPQPERVFALAEMSYDLGRKAESDKKPDAVFFYYLSAGFAYRYLIPDSPAVSSVTQPTAIRKSSA